MSQAPLEELALETLFHDAHLGLAIVDSDKRYLRVNERFAALNGVPAQEHIGRTPREVIPQIADAVESVLDHVLQTKLPMIGLEVPPPTGAMAPDAISARVSLYPLIREGRAVGVLGVAETAPNPTP